MRILIADDDRTSRTVLLAVLKKAGHEVVSTEDGDEAWEMISRPNSARLAILDWMMPGMSGVEICRRLRSDPPPRLPYVILVTSLDDKAHLVEGLEAGADDFVPKPFHPAELLARVSVAERITQAEDRLLADNARLEEMVEERAKLLIHADRMATIGTLAAGVAHEINNPTTFIAGNIRVLEQCMEVILKHLPETDCVKNKSDQLYIAIEELPKLSASMRQGVARIQNIVNGLLTYARKKPSSVHAPVEIEECIDEALALCSNRLKYGISVDRIKSRDPSMVMGDKQHLVQIITNLVINAIDAAETSREPKVHIETKLAGNCLEIAVKDSGPGISDAIVEKLFDPFFSTKGTKGTGLGLSITKNLVETHDGRIKVKNSDDGGAVFCVVLPSIKDKLPMQMEKELL